jgi:hypothetical protein
VMAVTDVLQAKHTISCKDFVRLLLGDVIAEHGQDKPKTFCNYLGQRAYRRRAVTDSGLLVSVT